MGADGGTKAVVRKFFRGAKGDNFDNEHQAVDKNQVKKENVKYCAYSSKKLSEPIVGCRYGFLYNKEDVLKAILNKELGETHKQISRRKYLINAELSKNPLYPSNSEFQFNCPFTQLEFNGLNEFIIFVQTGKVVSKRALKELDFSESGEYLDLYPSEEKLEELQKKFSLKRKRKSRKTEAKKKLSVEIR